MSPADANTLLRDALSVPFGGWDFSVLGDRIVLEPPPWAFEEMVDREAARAASMLDLGTGGGEWLSRRGHPARTVATESWDPNVPIAASRLRPLEIPVVRTEGAIDNVGQASQLARGRLPFRDGTFDLVLSRHEAFVASEVHRVLRPGAVFFTQQANSGAGQFHQLFDVDAPPDNGFHRDLAIDQLERVGFHIEDSGEGTATTVFADIGALAWYLTNVPWPVPGFSIDRYRDRLLALHGRPIRIRSERFWIRAVA